MFRAVVFLLLIVAVTINAAPNCGENQIFTPCGTKCPTTCQDQQPKACTLACIPGCECMEGYVRNANNQCVLLQNC